MMTATTITVDEAAAALQEAQREAAKHAEKLRAAEERAQAAHAAIEADRRSKYLAWCRRRIEGFEEDRKANWDKISGARAAFVAAVAEGDLVSALQRYLEWGSAAGEQSALLTVAQHAAAQVEPDRRLPEMSYRHYPADFTEELNKAIESAKADRNEDVRDAAQAEIEAAIRGEAV